MRRFTSALAPLTVVAPAGLAQAAASHAGPPAPEWGPASAVFPAGVRMAVLQGNAGANALFTVRLRFPKGYRIAPYTHATDEHLTIISGSFLVGMGNTFDASKTMRLGTGEFATAPANAAHDAQARTAAVVQLLAMGPFAMTYVNPADTSKPTAAR